MKIWNPKQHYEMKAGFLNHIVLTVIALTFICFAGSCSDADQDMRLPEDIMGVWKQNDSTYLEFSTNNEVHKLTTFLQDGETIGSWLLDVYFYEPGYNLVIYIDADGVGTVYEIVSLSDKTLTWCPVDTVSVETIDRESIGQVIGEIINKAQEGYHLNPELFVSFEKISYQEFLKLLESLDIMYPWG